MLLLLDDELRPVQRGETGGLYIGGVGLSPGYWKDPQETKQAFRPNPYSSNPFDRLYKTGDLAQFGADGVVYLIAPSDSQIENRGCTLWDEVPTGSRDKADQTSTPINQATR
jgi:non-ribosomal peptide synthetase component F